MAACRFCTIDSQRQQIIWRGELIYAILSNPKRHVDLHLLVIPVRHVEHLSDLSADERREFFDTIIEFQQKIRESEVGLGCDFSQHDRPFLPESEVKVNHIHGHLALRSYRDIFWREVQRHEKFDLIPPAQMRLEERRMKNLLLF